MGKRHIFAGIILGIVPTAASVFCGWLGFTLRQWTATTYQPVPYWAFLAVCGGGLAAYLVFMASAAAKARKCTSMAAGAFAGTALLLLFMLLGMADVFGWAALYIMSEIQTCFLLLLGNLFIGILALKKR